MKRYGLFVAYTLAIVIVVAGLSSGLTLLLTSQQRIENDDYIRITKEDFLTLQRFMRLEQLRETIHGEYIDEVEDSVLIDGAAEGMLYALGDPYSAYFTPEQTAQLQQAEEGLYHGIGCQLLFDQEDFLITVSRVYKDSPAEHAGVIPGDKIIEVFGEPFTGYEMTEAVRRMRGEPGTSAQITILRDGERMEMTIPRAQVNTNRVEVRMLEGDIGLVTLYEFDGDAVAGFKSALTTLEKNKAKGMILDLRGNPGGQLGIVTQISDLLLPEGTIVSIEDKHGNVNTFTSDVAMTSLPYVVLVNEMSASASEILAAAVQDYGTGKLIGTKTFGKGIVQSNYVFKDDNASMHLTTAHYYTPKGVNIHKIGVMPDIEVEMPEELQKNPARITDENDVQLLAAIAELQR